MENLCQRTSKEGILFIAVQFNCGFLEGTPYFSIYLCSLDTEIGLKNLCVNAGADTKLFLREG